jgi:hypothetical protein
LDPGDEQFSRRLRWQNDDRWAGCLQSGIDGAVGLNLSSTAPQAAYDRLGSIVIERRAEFSYFNPDASFLERLSFGLTSAPWRD